MKTAYLAIQCTTNKGETGSFIFTGDWEAVSPVYSSLAYLFPWLKANGWTEGPKDPAHPVGVYVREAHQ